MSFSKNFESGMEKFFLPVAEKISSQRHLQAVKDGLVLTLPLTIIGSIFLVFGFLPIPNYNEFMARIFGEMWLTRLLYPVSVTFDMVSVIASIGISYRLAKIYNVDAISASTISLVSFFLVTPGKIMVGEKSVSAFASSFLGGRGLFVALIIALISTEIYAWFIKKNIVIKMPEACPPAVAKSFASLIPATAIIFLFWILKIGVEFTSYEHIHSLVIKIISDPLTGFSATLLGGIVSVLLNSFFWSFGIHGGSITSAVFGPVFAVTRDANVFAFQNNLPIPHIISNEFLLNYVYIGGSGATLCLVLGYILYCKSKQYKEIGKLSMGASIFNINEPVIFGSPVVMNPMLMVPFIMTPVILTITSYFAVKSGLVAPAVLSVPWTMPIGISGFLTTGGKLSGSLLQMFNVTLGFFLYLPFLKILDRKNLAADTEEELLEEDGNYETIMEVTSEEVNS